MYGPAGLQSMTEHILQAYRIDIETRTNSEGNQRAIAEGSKVNVHEIKPGVIYKDANVTVTAFATKHAMESYGYRFDTPDRRIVISGDTILCRRPSRLVMAVLFWSPLFCDEVPYNYGTARGTCDQSQAEIARCLSHGEFPS